MLKDEVEKQKRARERQEAIDRAKAIIQGEDAVEWDRLIRNLRMTIDEVLAQHKEFSEFLIHLAAEGITLHLGKDEPLTNLRLRAATEQVASPPGRPGPRLQLALLDRARASV